MVNSQIYERMVFFNSILLALFISVPCLNQLLITFNSGFESVMTILYVTIIVSIFICSRFTDKVKNDNSQKAYLTLFIYVIVLYTFTILSGGKPYTSLSFFAVFTVVAFMIPQLIVVNAEVVVKATVLLAAPAFFRTDEIFYQDILGSEEMTMGQSYAFLTPIMASIIYFAYYFKKDGLLSKIFFTIGSVLNAFFLLEMFMYGSRGPVLSIMILLLFIYVTILPEDDSIGIKVNKRRLFWGSILIVICAFLFLSVFGFIQEFLANRGLHFYFIDKTLNLSEVGDISNGRSSIYPIVLEEFWNHPIFGHGFDLFYETGLYEYPHNFLLQIIYDGGIVMILVMLVPVLSRMFASFKQDNRNQLILLIFLLFISVSGASFSGDLWQQRNLWIFVGVLLCNNRMVV